MGVVILLGGGDVTTSHTTLWLANNSQSFCSYWYPTYSRCLFDGSEDAYTSSLGLVVRALSSRWFFFSSLMLILTHIEIMEQAAKGGLLKLQFKDFEFIAFL